MFAAGCVNAGKRAMSISLCLQPRIQADIIEALEAARMIIFNKPYYQENCKAD